MCGLTALLSLQPPVPQSNGHSTPPITPEEINNSLEIIKHRGPDARGQWISPDGQVGLGHVRLSIIDLSPSGTQPFHNTHATNDVHAIVNGELYDYERLRAQFAPEYPFQSHSDCELVLALYQHYGVSFLSHLRGEFALVLWDAKRKLLIAARDRYGIKSLYYTVHQGRLLVATEMKSFLAYGWTPEWDVRTLRENGWRFDERCYFRGVHKVLPGHYLVCREFGAVEQKPYWDLEYPDKRIVETRSEEEMILGVRERILEAVRLRLRADVPVGIYLSGGLDSSALAGVAAHLIKEEHVQVGTDNSGDIARLQCFCVQFDKDSGADESDIAQRTADWLGVELTCVHLDEAAIAAKFEDTAWHSEAPNPDANGIGKLALSEAVHAKGLKVVLTGEGADEHFAGYTLFAADALSEADSSWPLGLMPESEREEAWSQECIKSDIFQLGALPQNVPSSTKRVLNNARLPPSLCTHTPLPFAPWTDSYATSDPQTVLAESFNGRAYHNMATKWHPLHSSQYIWTKSVFPNIMLRYLGDNVDMVNHVESRTPYLDHHVTEYANALPPSLKMKYDPETKKLREKHILREAMKPFITEEIYHRAKHPYMGPVRYAADGPLHRVIQRLVTKENVEQLGFVDWATAEGLADKAFVQHDHSAFRNVLSLAQFIVIGRGFGAKKAGL
ncbi:asparagine synthetase B family protein [Aspergillus ibericus CBS 121593]|uniref:Asparagine synthetase n=1 Tax=Aspergillus ibericus CBS 121593 TaxID=1448316 RepID=A0A395GI31_9EURO|nr:asparagine synthetase [Aspergillus ibericus CBS 121593]RAK94836.1 asparagine synthetase [Aspergillus ibericus CBS 121593]